MSRPFTCNSSAMNSDEATPCESHEFYIHIIFHLFRAAHLNLLCLFYNV